MTGEELDNMKKEARIIKIEKGLYMVEWRFKLPFMKWNTVDKHFKTKTKATNYIIEHFG